VSTPTEKQIVRIRGSLARFESQSVSRLLKMVVPEASLSGENLEVLARRIIEPSWSRLAIRDLDDASLFALRVLAQLPHGAFGSELDTIARMAVKQEAGAKPPSIQLREAGIALVSLDSSFRRASDARLKVIGVLRERWLTLVPAPTSRFDLSEVSAAEERYRNERGEFELGIVLAAVEQLRPRATRVGDMHRGDEKAIVEKLAGLFGGEEPARTQIRDVLRSELVAEQGGRLLIDRTALAEWSDPLGMILLQKLADRRHSAVWRAVMGLMLSSSGWVSSRQLIEMAALAAFEHVYAFNPAQNVAAELADFARLPGLLTQEQDGLKWYRFSDAALRALEGELVPRSFGTGLLIQPNLQIVAQPGVPLAVLCALGAFCRIVSADQVAVFAFDEPTARRAATEGWTASQILTLLEQHSSHGVPSTVARALTDWVKTRASAIVAVGAIVLVDLPLVEMKRIAGEDIEVNELKAGVFRVDAGDGPDLVNALRKAQVGCRLFGAGMTEEDDVAERRGRGGATKVMRELASQAVDEVQRLRRVPQD
jgi:hypothetical protein